MPKSSLSKLILFFALLFGTLVRLYPVWAAGFPINDGGLFYRMVEDLIASGFREVTLLRRSDWMDSFLRAT
mgnify:CR=1 FL=1